MHRVWDELQFDAWIPILESLGQSLGQASATSSTWAQAVGNGEGAAFRPLSHVIGAPASGHVPPQRVQQAEVARLRRRDVATPSWWDLAKLAIRPTDTRSTWQTVALSGEQPSHRHSIAVCGGPLQEDGGETALLFGGNVSRNVAGNWRTSNELMLAKLPQKTGGACELSCLGGSPNGSQNVVTTPWPVSRWGASMASLASARYLVGGWSRDGDCNQVFALRFREAGVEWSPINCASSPPVTAFHTATALDDGKRFALVGGLGDSGSQKGIWYFQEDTESWHRVSDAGPSCAGHAAASIDERLVLFGGVQRSARAVFDGDRFSSATSLFDVRRQQWDETSNVQGSPISRRNPTYARVGRHMIISGGFDDTSSRALKDTWAFDASRCSWNALSCYPTAPALEGHKAVMSGFDLFSFGGHSGPGSYPARTMSVHTLSLGLSAESLAPKEGCSRGSLSTPECTSQSEDAEQSESSSDDEGTPFVRLPDGQLISLALLRALMQHEDPNV